MTAVPFPLPPRQALSDFLNALRKPSRLLVAVSGGSDSTGLLFLLHDLLATGTIANVTLTAATVDHRLRPEAAAEAETVGRLCARLGIPHHILPWTGSKPSHGLSAAAREARYRLLADLGQAEGITAVVTGHTLDDQRETVAMREMRSASPDDVGLAGMSPRTLYDRRLWIARPLLSSRRSDLRDELRAAGIRWIDDPSNEDLHYERVRVRRQLENLDGGGSVAFDTERRAAISQASAELLVRHAKGYAEALVFIEAAALETSPEVLRRALGALIMVLGGRHHPPGRASLDRVLAFVGQQTSGRLTAGRCLLVLRKEGLYVLRERRDVLSLEIAAGDIAVWDGRFRIRNLSDRPITVRACEQATPLDAATTLPTTVLRHLSSVLPEIHTGRPSSMTPTVECGAVLGGYDRFLPDTDLPLANAVAALLGRPGYLPPPV